MPGRRVSRRGVHKGVSWPRSLSPAVSHREWWAVAAIVLLAAVLRFANANRMAIEHFEEGVYASNVFFGPAEHNRYPDRHLYAPPLLPGLIEACIAVFGVRGIAPFLPALALGIATVPLAWWAVRCWWGSSAGLAAAFLVATSDFHLLYSRTALTEVPVAFFMLLAIYFYWEAVRRNRIAWSLAAGVATGLAWWTIYTGWLPLAIASAGSLAWIVFERRSVGVSRPRRARIVAKCSFTTAATALAVWSPVWLGLQKFGGYAAVAANHRSDLQPLAEWPHNLWEQLGNIAEQSGAFTTVGLACLAFLVPMRTRWPLPIRLALALWCAVMVGWCVFEIGPAVPLALLAVVGLGIELASVARPVEDQDDQPDDVESRPATRLAGWLLAAWLAGTLAATPFSHPYPRLMMPWLLAAMLAVAVWGRRLETGTGMSRHSTIFALSLLTLPAVFLASEFHPEPWFTAKWRVPGWQSRTGARVAAVKLIRALDEDRPPGEPALLYVASEPATFFHLRAQLIDKSVRVVPVTEVPTRDRVPDDVPAYFVFGGIQDLPFADELVESAQAANTQSRLHYVQCVPRSRSELLQLDSQRVPRWVNLRFNDFDAECLYRLAP